LTKEHLESL